MFLRSDKEKNEEEILEMKEMAFAKKKEREEKLLKKARESINQWGKDSVTTLGVDRDRDGEESEDEDEDNVEALNSFGRTTSSSLSASVLTWLTNIAGR